MTTTEQIAGGGKVSKAIDDVLAERRRQIDVEGFDAAHDSQHAIDQSLVQAAVCYAQHYVDRSWVFNKGQEKDYRGENRPVPPEWPQSWSEKWWKPHSPRRDLVKAAALLIAEIERLDAEASGD